MTIEERLENLEGELTRAKRRNRWLVAAFGLGVLGLAGAWLTNETAGPALAGEAAKATGPAQVIRATAFVLVDDKGRERGKFEMSKDGPAEGGPSLTLNDEKGKMRAMLALPLGQPSLTLHDDKDNSYRVLLQEDGLFLRDKNDKLRAGLGVISGQPQLVLDDENEKPRAGLIVVKKGPLVRLNDEDGKTIWQAP